MQTAVSTFLWNVDWQWLRCLLESHHFPTRCEVANTVEFPFKKNQDTHNIIVLWFNWLNKSLKVALWLCTFLLLWWAQAKAVLLLSHVDFPTLTAKTKLEHTKPLLHIYENSILYCEYPSSCLYSFFYIYVYSLTISHTQRSVCSSVAAVFTVRIIYKVKKPLEIQSCQCEQCVGEGFRMNIGNTQNIW